MAFGDGNLATMTSAATDKARLHSGFSSTIDDSWTESTVIPYGASSDATNFYSTKNGWNRQHSGFSSTVNDSFTLTGNRGITWDGTDTKAVSDEGGTEYALHYSGFSSTVSSSFTIGSGVNPLDCTDDGTDFYISRVAGYKQQSGFSSTVSDSFTAGTAEGGFSWDGTNAMDWDESQNKFHLFSGFSSTVTTSFAGYSATYGIEWDSADRYASAGGGFTPKVIMF